MLYVADHGAPRNTRRYKPLRDGVAELKKDRVRVYCFFDGPGRIVRSVGSVQHSPKRQTRDIDRAVALREAYLKTKAKKW